MQATVRSQFNLHSVVIRRVPAAVVDGAESKGVDDEGHEEELIPARFLTGAIPDALLLRYRIWQSVRDRRRLVGEPFDASDQTSLDIQLAEDGGAATITRRSVSATGEVQFDRVFNLGGFDARTTQPGADTTSGTLHRIARWASRLECLGQVLVTSRSTPIDAGEECPIASVEFPRLGLTFEPRPVGVDHSVRLYCRDYAGKFVSDTRSDELRRHLRGIPHGVVLEDENGQQCVLRVWRVCVCVVMWRPHCVTSCVLCDQVPAGAIV